MRLGFCLPQVGAVAGPDAIAEVARAAERTGYDSVWVLDRLLFPEKPKLPYPATADGSLPEGYRRSMDPLVTLAWAAAATEKIALGTSVLVLSTYNPVLLARQLATLDVLSGGRLRVGVGAGWSPDEHEAAGVSMKERGSRAEEALELILAIWGGGKVAHEGRHFSLPASIFDLVPAQRPRPKVYMAGYTPATLARVGRLADGWIPAGVPNVAIPAMFSQAREAASRAGRDADALELVIRANITLLPEPVAGERYSFVGSLGQIAEDVAQLRELGAHEVHFDVQFSPGVATLGDQLEKLEELYAAATG